MPAFPYSLPAPRTPDPMDAPTLHWGVLGTGWIAERFVSSVQRHTRQRFTAVASRDAARAREFGGRHGIPLACSYEELVACPDVDVVYVATGHAAHLSCARLALEAGKHALIEKPLGLNAAQAAEIARLAARQNLFCAEALWTFFLPRFDIVRQILDSGVLGEIRTVMADIGEYFGHRILSPELAGGPLLDLGTYPVALASWVMGPPDQVLAVGQPHPSGVNGQVARSSATRPATRRCCTPRCAATPPPRRPSQELAPPSSSPGRSTNLGMSSCSQRAAAPPARQLSHGPATTPFTSRPPKPPAASPRVLSSIPCGRWRRR